jgi:transcriptional regulator with XRE-family HTH domain
MPTPSPKHAHDPALVALGETIRSLRKAQGISQEELAHRSQVDRAYMSSIERGTQNPGVMTIFRIAEGMNISVAEIFAVAKL